MNSLNRKSSLLVNTAEFLVRKDKVSNGITKPVPYEIQLAFAPDFLYT